MEYKELEILWKRYDEKLDNLEKINKKLLKSTMLQKSQKKLNWLEFHNLYGVIAAPIIFFVVLRPILKTENIGWIFILGCILIFIVILYLCIMMLRSYLILKEINLYTDSVIKSLNEISKLKKNSNTLHQSVFIHYPVLYVGVILIGWNGFVSNANTIIILSLYFVITYVLNIWGVGKHKERINRLEKDIIELKEYTEE